jgi:hypothetical protein
VGQLADHLRSPQFTDENGDATGPTRMAMVVAPGKPRWLGYAFYVVGFVLGAVLATGLIDIGEQMGSDLVQIIGVVGMIGAVYGAWEVWRGKPPSARGLIDRIRGR